MKRRNLFFVLATLLMGVTVLFSCQKEIVDQEDLVLKNGVICDCVDEITPVTVNVLGGGATPSKIGEVKIWNDNSKVYLTIGTFSFDKVKVVGFLSPDAIMPANSVFNANVVASATNTVELDYDIPVEWAFCTEYRFYVKIEGKAGGTETYQINYTPYPICGCEYEGNSFSGNAISCDETREVEYFFSSEEGVPYFKMQGGLTNFSGNLHVFIDGVEVTFNTVATEEPGNDDWYEDNNIEGYVVGYKEPGESSNFVVRLIGGLGECEAVIVKLTWDATNSDTHVTGNWSVRDLDGNYLDEDVYDLMCD